MKNIFKYIPMVTLGQILGTVVAFPLLIFLINIFYFSNKYNDVTELNADVYIKRSVIKEITMPAYDSGKYIGKPLKIIVLMNGKTRGFLYVLIRMRC